VQFRLPAYGTIVAFNDWIYLDSFEWDAINATQITFRGISLGTEAEKADVTFSVKNANLTVTQLSSTKQFIGILNGLTNTFAELSVTHSLYQSMPSMVTVGGVVYSPLQSKQDFDRQSRNCWHYDPNTKTVYIKALLQSPVLVSIYWVTAPTESGGGSEGNVIWLPTAPFVETPSVSVPTLPSLATSPEIVKFGLLVIVLAGVAALVVKEVQERAKLSYKFKTAFKPAKVTKKDWSKARKKKWWG
jgi:hypothetical protein